MAWVAVAVGVVGAAAGAYGANRQASAARGAQRSSDEAARGQEAIQREQLADSRQRYADWQRRFNPAYDAMADIAYESVNPDFESVEADIGRQFDNSREINERNRFRMGYNPTDGAQAADQREYGLGRALGIAGGRNAARATARDESFNRLTRYVDAGNGLRASADNMTGAAYAGIASAFGQRANMQNQNAQMYRAQAQDSWGQVATGLGYASGAWGGKGGGGWGAQTGGSLNATAFGSGGSPMGNAGGVSNGYYNPPRW